MRRSARLSLVSAVVIAGLVFGAGVANSYAKDHPSQSHPDESRANLDDHNGSKRNNEERRVTEEERATEEERVTEEGRVTEEERATDEDRVSQKGDRPEHGGRD